MSVLGQPGGARFLITTGVVTAVLAGVLLFLFQGGVNFFSGKTKALTYSVYESPQISSASGLTAFSVLTVTNRSEDVANNVLVEIRMPAGEITERSYSTSDGVVVTSERRDRSVDSLLIRELNPKENVKLSVMTNAHSGGSKPEFVVRAPGFLSSPASTDLPKDTVDVPFLLMAAFATLLSSFVTSIFRGGFSDGGSERKWFMTLVLRRAGLHDLAEAMSDKSDSLSYKGAFDLIYGASLESQNSDAYAKAIKLALINPRLAKRSRKIGEIYLEKLLPGEDIERTRAEVAHLSDQVKSSADLRRVILDAAK